MCVLLTLAYATGYKEGEKHTSSTEISERISITSRAAWRLDASSTLGILLAVREATLRYLEV